jgi:hypothetical protein
MPTFRGKAKVIAKSTWFATGDHPIGITPARDTQ